MSLSVISGLPLDNERYPLTYIYTDTLQYSVKLQRVTFFVIPTLKRVLKTLIHKEKTVVIR